MIRVLSSRHDIEAQRGVWWERGRVVAVASSAAMYIEVVYAVKGLEEVGVNIASALSVE